MGVILSSDSNCVLAEAGVVNWCTILGGTCLSSAGVLTGALMAFAWCGVEIRVAVNCIPEFPPGSCPPRSE